MEVVIGKDGTVGEARVTKSLDAVYGLDDQAVATAKEWEFSPAVRFGERVSTVARLALYFSIPDLPSVNPIPFAAGRIWSIAPLSATEENLLQVRSEVEIDSRVAVSYDVVVGVTELDSEAPAVQLLRSEVFVLGHEDELSLSSVILTEHEVLVPDSGAANRVRDPYVFGRSFVAPVLDSTFSTSETLEVFFQIYKATQTIEKTPDVTVEYRLHRQSAEAGAPPTELAPQLYNENTLPAGFDGFAAFNVSRVIPLADLEPDRYRLEIRVTDNSVEYPGLVYAIVEQTDWDRETFQNLIPVRKRTLFKYVEFTVSGN